MNNELKSAIERNSEDNAKLVKIKNALDNVKSVIPMYEMYSELFEKTGVRQEYKGINSINVWGDKFGVALMCTLPYKVEFEKIADMFSELEVRDGTIYAMARYTIERVFEGITFTLSDYCTAELPEDYVEVLEMLGKIKTETREASTETYVSCAI